MKFRVGIAAVTAMVISVLTVVVPPASAQSCSNIACVAAALKTNPVYQDPAAENKLSTAQQDELRAKIGTREPRVFIALLPLRAADANGGVNEVPGKIGQALGIPASVGVVAGNSFRARSGGGQPFETNQISKLATDAFEKNNPGQQTPKGNVMPMLLSFVDGVHNAPQVQPKAAPTAGAGSSQTQFQPAKKKSNTGRNILLFFLFLLIVGAAIVTFVVVRNKRRFQDRKASVSTKVLGLQTAIFQTENGGDFFNTEAKGHLRRAERHWDQADTNLRADDLDEAERSLERGYDALGAATAMANEPEPPPPDPIDIPITPRPAAKRTTTKKGAKGKTPIPDEPLIERAAVDHEGRIVINNNVQTPRDREDDEYRHYFPGGYYGGRYIYGGYYPMNFWDYMVLDSMLNDRRGSDGHHHDTGGGKDNGGNEREAATVGGGSWDGGGDSYVAPVASSGSWGGSSESSAGGGDWDTPDPAPAPDPEPSYTPPPDPPRYDPPDPPSRSYDPPPSYDPPSTGGGDWGGGGGSDSGSGGSGGGDW